MRILCSALLGVAAFAAGHANVAMAHFLWVDVPTAGSASEAVFWFSEQPEPGEADLLDRIAGTKAWQRLAGGKTSALAPKKASNGSELAAPLEPAKSYAIGARCDYGVFSRGKEPVLLHYYAKHLAADAPAHLAGIARDEQLPLDVVPTVGPGGVELRVIWNGQPATGVEITTAGADGEPRMLTTDAAGRAALGPIAGKLALRVRKLEAGRSGQLDGKPYHSVLHYTTLTMALPMENRSANDSQRPSANELLKRARQSRSTWENFPGFHARLSVNTAGYQGTGRLTIDSAGDVKLSEFPPGLDEKQVKGYFESLAQHRLADPAAEDEVEYAADQKPHPLGPLITFVGDEKLQSSYRIRDNVVTQVNRVMGDTRFTIDVLDVYRDPRGRYVPELFTVSFWDKNSGALTRSETHVNHWTAVGAFELPTSIIVARFAPGKNGPGESKVLEMTLDQFELLKAIATKRP